MVESLELLVALWPLALGFVSLVIILAKMHSAIEVINEKVKVLFELYNNIRAVSYTHLTLPTTPYV